MKKVLFICTGNYYRSRFAEILFNYQARLHQLEWVAFSAGTEADKCRNEGPVSKHAVERLDKLNIPVNGNDRYPLQLTSEHITLAEKIILLNENEHLPYIRKFYNHHISRIEMWKVNDVEIDEPSVALKQIENEVEKLIDQLLL